MKEFMKKLMPQEIEVWYLLPALRREIARFLIKDFKLSQKKAAEILGVTEAAVSQYFKSKRGNEIKFSLKDLGKIKQVSKKIVENPGKLMDHLYELSIYFRGSKVVCDIHRGKDKNVSKECKICMGG